MLRRGAWSRNAGAGGVPAARTSRAHGPAGSARGGVRPAAERPARRARGAGGRGAEHALRRRAGRVGVVRMARRRSVRAAIDGVRAVGARRVVGRARHRAPTVATWPGCGPPACGGVTGCAVGGRRCQHQQGSDGHAVAWRAPGPARRQRSERGRTVAAAACMLSPSAAACAQARAMTQDGTGASRRTPRQRRAPPATRPPRPACARPRCCTWRASPRPRPGCAACWNAASTAGRAPPRPRASRASTSPPPPPPRAPPPPRSRAAMVQAGAVDDAAFAASRARRLARTGRSRRAIAAHLAGKGVDAQTAAAALPEGEEAELDAALAYCRRRRIGPFARAAEDADARRKALAALARGGFGHAVARRALAMDPAAAEDRLLAARRQRRRRAPGAQAHERRARRLHPPRRAARRAPGGAAGDRHLPLRPGGRRDLRRQGAVAARDLADVGAGLRRVVAAAGAGILDRPGADPGARRWPRSW